MKKDQNFIFEWGGGERCQALECGRARYLPSLIDLFNNVFITFGTVSSQCVLLYKGLLCNLVVPPGSRV